MPENYAEVAPSDYKAVVRNLKLLDEILSPSDPYHLKSFIESLKIKIYPKIDLFLDDAKIVLSEQFGMDLTGSDFTIQKVRFFLFFFLFIIYCFYSIYLFFNLKSKNNNNNTNNYNYINRNNIFTINNNNNNN